MPLQEQLRLRTMRSQVAMSLRLCLGQCRVALKFYVLGWTGTLPSVSNTDLPVGGIVDPTPFSCICFQKKR